MNVNLEIRFVKNKLIYDYIDFFKTRINISSAKPGQRRYLSGFGRCTVFVTHWKQANCLWFLTLVIAFVFHVKSRKFLSQLFIFTYSSKCLGKNQLSEVRVKKIKI